MDDLLRRWAECNHDQSTSDPDYYLCRNGCGAWVEYINGRFELRLYIIEEEVDLACQAQEAALCL